MSFQRKDLAIHPKRADPLLRAELQGRQEGLGIRQAEGSELRERGRPFEPAGGRGRRRAEFDRRIAKGTAETKPNHANLGQAGEATKLFPHYRRRTSRRRACDEERRKNRLAH